MKTIDEVRADLESLVGQMVSVNRAGPIKLYTVEQATEDGPYEAWAASDWLMAVGDPGLEGEPLAWSWSTLEYMAANGVTVTAVQT